MGVFALFSYSARSVEVTAAGSDMITINETQVSGTASSQPIESSAPTKPDAVSDQDPAAGTNLYAPSKSDPQVLSAKNDELPLQNNENDAKLDNRPSLTTAQPAHARLQRTFAHNFLLFRGHDKHKPALSASQESLKKAHVATSASSTRLVPLRTSRSDRKAKKSALVVRSLILGPDVASPKLTTTNAKPQLNKVKSQLIEPKSAQKVIAQLRVLPISDNATDNKGVSNGPIRAVCLEHPDAEEDRLHFANLAAIPPDAHVPKTSFFDASIDQVAAMFHKMNVVSLIKSPDFGLGQPGDGDGLLAGAVPTAETVMRGFEEITPQLMALGYATGKAIVPSHSGIYPPTDRMSVLTYWWGLEVLLPPPSLDHLADVQSIAGNIVNFLTALSLINNGVREIVPFVRYIAQFIDFEFNAIKRQDKGRGVVCAATWIMPAAMVPRSWDFPDPPVPSEEPKASPTVPSPPAESQAPPATPPIVIPPSLPTFADSLVGAYADSVHFQTAVPPEPPKAPMNA